MTIRSIDVPQADLLASVRHIVEAMADSPEASSLVLAKRTGISDRHVRYRMATARVLDLVADGKEGTVLTVRGRRLLRTERGSPGERQQLRQAVETCLVVREIVPDLLSAETFDFGAVGKRIMNAAGLSQATAERRAQVLRAWRRQLR